MDGGLRADCAASAVRASAGRVVPMLATRADVRDACIRLVSSHRPRGALLSRSPDESVMVWYDGIHSERDGTHQVRTRRASRRLNLSRPTYTHVAIGNARGRRSYSPRRPHPRALRLALPRERR